MDATKQDTKDRMEKAITALERDFGKLRTGRATISLVETIKVDYYGTPTPMNQVASIATPDSRTITIQPWDKGAFKAIEKAILISDIGLNPVNDGILIRLSVPALTEERRKEFVKMAKKYGEETKVAVRNIRRDANETLKKLEKDQSYSEDDLKRAQDDVQKMTDSFVATVDQKCALKEKDIMEI